MRKLEDEFSEVTLGTLQKWVATRETQNMPAELIIYMEMIERCYQWHQSMALEPEIIDNLLTHYDDKFNGNRNRAKQIYADAINHFYLDNDITQEAWANVYADRLDKAAILIIRTAESAQDIAKAKDLWKEAATLRGAYAEKKEQLPKEVYEQRYYLYTNKITDLGLPEQSRPEIKAIIRGLPLPAEEMLRLEQEADLLPKTILDWNEPEKEDK
ncbi:hypothetical protein ACH3O9_11350 [Leeuwenhoekiella sp. A16]|uniref:hypothetical protein n=1 Tax=Leeuwenhoekiella sp. A16 TaxID=3141462 RepID=UPI003A80D478